MRPQARVGLTILLSATLSVACADRDTFTTNAASDPGLASTTATACASRANNSSEKLLECVTLDGVRTHQQALQAIADANGGNRAVGTPGYDASLSYIRGQLQAAGYAVTTQTFTFNGFIILSQPVLDQISPVAASIPTTIFSYSGSGDVTAPVTVVPNIGCDPADYAGFVPGTIALILRGTCTFAVKATNAYNAGAAGVVIYNNTPGMTVGTLGTQFTLNIPVVGITQADGQQLSVTPGLVLRVRTNTRRGDIQTANLLAETSGGDPDNVVMVGAHLDGVTAGPGINDNGSGSGAILETALQMARVTPRNKVRFAWWGAEEVGLVGSWHYVESLSSAERNKIALYLNFDMIGSPNPGYFVYDGGFAAQGSSQITSLLEQFYSARGIASERLPMTSGSDHVVFMNVGIPTGGMISGAGGIKTPEQVALWGGTAGTAFDPCYHQACDTYDNVNLVALGVNADAVAHATISLAMSTELVNGIKGKGNFSLSGSRAPAPTHSHGDEAAIQ